MNISEVRKTVSNTNLKHIAIIMDGNRRWAKSHALPSAAGHVKGVSALKKVVKACDDFGVKYLAVFAFSTENKKRTETEVAFLMKLVSDTLEKETDELSAKNAVIKFIGNIGELDPKIQKVIRESEEKTSKNTGVNFQIAFNSGARAEILDAFKKIAEEKKDFSKLTEEDISQNLYTKDMPDPDLLIRTGGEMRVSNFLLWQIAYAELYVTDTFWPDFDENSLATAITEYSARQRRFGK